MMTTVDTLKRLLAERILVLDGAMGTMVQRHKLSEADFRGERFKNHPKDLKGNNDVLVLTRPDVIAGIHAEYLAAGADIIETNTFSGTSVSQGDYGLEALAYELNFEATKLAKRVAAEWTAKTPGQAALRRRIDRPDDEDAVDLAGCEQPGVSRHHVRRDA